MLREDPTYAHAKDINSGYTALHWAAKIGNLDLIKGRKISKANLILIQTIKSNSNVTFLQKWA